MKLQIGITPVLVGQKNLSADQIQGLDASYPINLMRVMFDHTTPVLTGNPKNLKMANNLTPGIDSLRNFTSFLKFFFYLLVFG